MRKDYNINIEKELLAINELNKRLITDGFNAENTVVLTVSTDYSSITGQIIRHGLSINGEIADGFGVDVPYPDQTWDNDFINELLGQFMLNSYKIQDKTLLLVENAIIRGGNYTFLVNWIKEKYPRIKVVTLSLFENINSVFKSDYVYDYYNNEVQDITFSWERPNNHW